MSKPKKNWDKILQEYSSGEEGDEHDIPNIASVKKNAEKFRRILKKDIAGLCLNFQKSGPLIYSLIT